MSVTLSRPDQNHPESETVPMPVVTKEYVLPKETYAVQPTQTVVKSKIVNMTNELRLPELDYHSHDKQYINYQLQASRLLQANKILSELILQAVLDKYTLSEKILAVQEQIRKMQLKSTK